MQHFLCHFQTITFHPVSGASEAHDICLFHPQHLLISLLGSCDHSQNWWKCWHLSFSSPQHCHLSEQSSCNPDNRGWLSLSQNTGFWHLAFYVYTLNLLPRLQALPLSKSRVSQHGTFPQQPYHSPLRTNRQCSPPTLSREIHSAGNSTQLFTLLPVMC